MLHKVLAVFKMVWGLTNQGANDVSQLLGHSICNGAPIGNNGPKGGPQLCVFWEGHKILGQLHWWVHFPVTVVTEFLMSLSVWESLFLSLVVGSLVILQVLVSASKDRALSV